MKNKLILTLCTLLATTSVSLGWAAEGGKDGDGEGGNYLWQANDPYYKPTITFRELRPDIFVLKGWFTINTLFLGPTNKSCTSKSMKVIAENADANVIITADGRNAYLYRSISDSYNIRAAVKEVNSRCPININSYTPIGILPLPEFLQLLQNQSAMIASRSHLLLSQLDQLFAKHGDPLQLQQFKNSYLDMNTGLQYDFRMYEPSKGYSVKGLAEVINTLIKAPALQMSGGAEILSQVNTKKLEMYYDHFSFQLHTYLAQHTNFSQIQTLHQQSFRYLVGSAEWLAIKAQITSLWQPRYYAYAVAFKSNDPNRTVLVTQLIFEMVERYSLPTK